LINQKKVAKGNPSLGGKIKGGAIAPIAGGFQGKNDIQ